MEVNCGGQNPTKPIVIYLVKSELVKGRTVNTKIDNLPFFFAQIGEANIGQRTLKTFENIVFITIT